MGVKSLIRRVKKQDREFEKNPIMILVNYIVAALAVLPLFIIFYQFVPPIILPIGEGVRVDHVLTFIILLVGILFLIRFFARTVYSLIGFGVILLTFNSVVGGYGFSDIYDDYETILFYMGSDSLNAPMKKNYQPFRNALQIKKAIDSDIKKVRNYSVEIATKHFKKVKSSGDNRKLIQAFSIFKEVNDLWIYVNDPRGGEYYASASETIDQLKVDSSFKGDCDDHTILMSSCLRNIGCQSRLVRTVGHIYPELKIGTMADLEDAVYLIRYYFFEKESRGQNIYYHKDENNDVWLNFDYTSAYPGGEFMSEEIIGILNI